VANVLVGHLVGLGCGFLGMAIMNAWNAPKVNETSSVGLARLGAAVIAVVATTFINLELDSGQPAALATPCWCLWVPTTLPWVLWGL